MGGSYPHLMAVNTKSLPLWSAVSSITHPLTLAGAELERKTIYLFLKSISFATIVLLLVLLRVIDIFHSLCPGMSPRRQLRQSHAHLLRQQKRESSPPECRLAELVILPWLPLFCPPSKLAECLSLSYIFGGMSFSGLRFDVVI